MSDSIAYKECLKIDFEPVLEMCSKLFKDSSGSELKKMIEHSFESNHIKVLVAKALNQEYTRFAIISIRKDYVEGAKKHLLAIWRVSISNQPIGKWVSQSNLLS